MSATVCVIIRPRWPWVTWSTATAPWAAPVLWKLPELWTPCPRGRQTGNAPTSSLETAERFPQLPHHSSFIGSRFFGTTGPR